VLAVNSAMAVPHKIYLPFAGFLARHGIASFLYHYRGIAGSAPKSLRGCEANVVDWARQDFRAGRQPVGAFRHQRWTNCANSPPSCSKGGPEFWRDDKAICCA
jgi:predicted alpha/beta hydrolase